MGQISINPIQSTGTWLKDCLAPQMHFVNLEIHEDDGSFITEVQMSFEQFATLLIRGRNTCTLSNYRGKQGGLDKEVVEPPESIEDRLSRRLGKTETELQDRIEDIYKDVHEMLNGGKKGKKELEELLHEIKVLKSHFKSNQKFRVQQAQEESKEVIDSLLQQAQITLKDQGSNFILPRLTPELSERIEEPIVTDYVPKQRTEKEVDEMTNMEVAEQIHLHLKRWEKKFSKKDENVKKTFLWNPNCTATKKSINIQYISYQGNTTISSEEGKAYLKFLMTTDQFKQHWHI